MVSEIFKKICDLIFTNQQQLAIALLHNADFFSEFYKGWHPLLRIVYPLGFHQDFDETDFQFHKPENFVRLLQGTTNLCSTIEIDLKGQQMPTEVLQLLSLVTTKRTNRLFVRNGSIILDTNVAELPYQSLHFGKVQIKNATMLQNIKCKHLTLSNCTIDSSIDLTLTQLETIDLVGSDCDVKYSCKRVDL